MADTYRENVAIIISNAVGKVLLCARADRPGKEWQFPQGGIDAGETVLEAAYRELREETGIGAEDVELIKEMPYGVKYRFPNAVIKHFSAKGGNNVGQNQHYVLFLLKNDAVKIDFETHPEEIEFKDSKWADIDDAPKEIVFFKKNAYQKAANFFKPYLEQIKSAQS